MLNDEQIIERFSQNSVAQEMCFNKNDSEFIKACLKEWHRPHRFYHGINHLSRLMKEIGDPSTWPLRERFWMEVLALTHDVICYPAVNDNEERSIDFIQSNMWRLNLDYGMKNPLIVELVKGINCTKYKKSNDFRKQGEIPHYLEIFCRLDIGLSCMSENENEINEVANREIQLIKEFQLWDFPISMIRGLSKFQNSDIGKYIPDKYEYAVVTK